jgi:glycosyltransferase involved in cell wall biosynthesis
MTKILIAGFPYVRDRYFATFRDPSIRDEVVFLLPRRWTAKGGSVVFTPPRDERVTAARALFHHSHVPVIGGLLKGWMPAFPLVLWRMRHSVSLVYSCSEPTLLTTLYQAVWARVLGKRHICFTWENIPYARKLSPMSRMVHEGILRLVLTLSDGLICGNEAGLRLHRSYSNIPMEVIPMNGVDVTFFAPHATTRRMFRGQDLSGKFVISFIGAIGKRKGLDVLVLAFARVVQSMPHAQLIIAGSGEYDAELTRRIEEAGISRSVMRRVSSASYSPLPAMISWACGMLCTTRAKAKTRTSSPLRFPIAPINEITNFPERSCPRNILRVVACGAKNVTSTPFIGITSMGIFEYERCKRRPASLPQIKPSESVRTRRKIPSCTIRDIGDNLRA